MKFLAVIFVAVALTACGIEKVDTGYRGIETRFGAIVGEPLPEGLYFYNPFTSDISEYSVRKDSWESKTVVFTSDNQSVTITFAVNYSPEPSAVGKLYKEVGQRLSVEETIIKPSVLGALQAEIGKTSADELNQKKDAIRSTTLKVLQETMAAKDVAIYDLNFLDTDFEDAYEKAAEEKVVAIQQAQKAKNESVKIEEEAKQTVTTAKAQAESMRIQSEALSKNQNLVSYEIAKKWDGKLPVYMMGNSVPLIDFKSLGK